MIQANPMASYVDALNPSTRQVVNKPLLTEAAIPTKFEDSSDATAFFEDIQTRMNARVLMQWAKSTDNNFDTNAVAKLKAAITAYNAFIDELESAE